MLYLMTGNALDVSSPKSSFVNKIPSQAERKGTPISLRAEPRLSRSKIDYRCSSSKFSPKY